MTNEWNKNQIFKFYRFFKSFNIELQFNLWSAVQPLQHADNGRADALVGIKISIDQGSGLKNPLKIRQGGILRSARGIPEGMVTSRIFRTLSGSIG